MEKRECYWFLSICIGLLWFFSYIDAIDPKLNLYINIILGISLAFAIASKINIEINTAIGVGSAFALCAVALIVIIIVTNANLLFPIIVTMGITIGLSAGACLVAFVKAITLCLKKD